MHTIEQLDIFRVGEGNLRLKLEDVHDARRNQDYVEAQYERQPEHHEESEDGQWHEIDDRCREVEMEHEEDWLKDEGPGLVAVEGHIESKEDVAKLDRLCRDVLTFANREHAQNYQMDHVVVDVVVGEVAILVAEDVENERHKYEEPYEASNDIQGRCH